MKHLGKLFLFLVLSQSFAFAKPILLISSFEPFDTAKGAVKAQFNASNLVADQLKKSLESKYSEQIEIEHIILPVAYSQTTLALNQAIQSLPERPKWIISFGQSGDSYVRFESLATNLIDTNTRDNLDYKPMSALIDTNLNPGASVGFNSNTPELFCGLSSSSRKLSIMSFNAGSFICNYLTFYVSKQLEAGALNSYFQFIHVPVKSKKLTNADYLSKFFPPVFEFVDQYLNTVQTQKTLFKIDKIEIKSRLNLIKQLPSSSQKNCLKQAYQGLETFF